MFFFCQSTRLVKGNSMNRLTYRDIPYLLSPLVHEGYLIVRLCGFKRKHTSQIWTYLFLN